MNSSEPSYRITRQRHLGEALDDLVRLGWLRDWRWDYDNGRRTAHYWVLTAGDADPVRYETRTAEILVQEVCSNHSVTWHPAAHAGGRAAREAAVVLNRTSGYYDAVARSEMI